MRSIIMSSSYTIINGASIVMIDGRVISGGGSCAEPKEIDKTKKIRADDITQIRVSSNNANVTISIGDRDDVEVHYHGKVYTDGDVDVDINKFGQEATINVENTSNNMYGNLQLDVIIPQKIFECISVKTVTGNVLLYRNVEAKKIKINSVNGNLVEEVCCEEIDAQSQNGIIDIFVIPKSNIEMYAKSINGSVTVDVSKFGLCTIRTSSVNGLARNEHIANGKFRASGKVSSINGMVRVH